MNNILYIHLQNLCVKRRISNYCTNHVTKYVHIKSTTVYAPRRNWDFPPTPHPQASVPPPPCFWGEGNTRWRERGWESPNSDEGHTLWYSLYVRTLCNHVVVLHCYCLFCSWKKQTIFQEDVKVVYQPSGRCMVLTAGETISNQLSGVIVLFAATAASNRQYTLMSIYWIMA